MSVTFSIAVKYVYVMGSYNSNNDHTYPYVVDYYSYEFVKMSNLTTSFVKARIFIVGGSSDQMAWQYAKRSSDNKTVYWYNDYESTRESNVFNVPSATYIFMGLY